MSLEYSPRPPPPQVVDPSEIEYVPEVVFRLLAHQGWVYHSALRSYFTHKAWRGYFSWSEALAIINARALLALGE